MSDYIIALLKHDAQMSPENWKEVSGVCHTARDELTNSLSRASWWTSWKRVSRPTRRAMLKADRRISTICRPVVRYTAKQNVCAFTIGHQPGCRSTGCFATTSPGASFYTRIYRTTSCSVLFPPFGTYERADWSCLHATVCGWTFNYTTGSRGEQRDAGDEPGCGDGRERSWAKTKVQRLPWSATESSQMSSQLTVRARLLHEGCRLSFRTLRRRDHSYARNDVWLLPFQRPARRFRKSRWSRRTWKRARR